MTDATTGAASIALRALCRVVRLALDEGTGGGADSAPMHAPIEVRCQGGLPELAAGKPMRLHGPVHPAGSSLQWEPPIVRLWMHRPQQPHSQQLPTELLALHREPPGGASPAHRYSARRPFCPISLLRAAMTRQRAAGAL